MLRDCKDSKDSKRKNKILFQTQLSNVIKGKIYFSAFKSESVQDSI